ncbi:MAG: dTDP-4-dehydrorhamnose reductase [Pseudomonadota bacterium]
MTLLVFGKTGQVATELALRAPQARFVARTEADLAQPAQVAAVLAGSDASAILNAAAYTAVDRAEGEAALAHVVNGAAVGVMAEHAAAQGIPFVQISTDYVFDGAGTQPFEPDHATAPLGVYGASKLAGEAAVRAAGGPHVILRTSWVFSAHGANFLKTMLRLSETRDALNIVADQVGGPTPAGAIAEACLTIADALQTAPEKTGTYHFAGHPDASWADFARAIFAAADRDVAVTDIPTAEYPTPATRPLNSRLDCSATERVFGLARPDWRAATQQIVTALT